MKKVDGKIIKLTGGLYSVAAGNEIYQCKARGRFRNENIKPLVGDRVNIQVISDGVGYILEVYKRKNELKRPPIANIDIAFIIMSVVEPKFSTNLVDKLITVVEANNIEPIICISKMDIASKKQKEDIKKIIKYYKQIGYKVLLNNQIRKIKKAFKNKEIVFTGQSGVGKSTLLNRLNKNLNIKTAPISKALGRGKHTTTHVELIPMFGGLIADTPGFSAIDLAHLKKENIKDYFIEFRNSNCKFKGCKHLNEPGCNVKKKVEQGIIQKTRYNNYKKFMEE